MVIKELERLIEFMESDYSYDWLDQGKGARRYLIDIINGLFSVQNISYYEKGMLKILIQKLEQDCKIVFTPITHYLGYRPHKIGYPPTVDSYTFTSRISTPKCKDDYVNDIKEVIDSLKQNEKEKIDKLIEDYKNITKEVEGAIKQSDKLKDIANNHYNNLKGYV